MHTHKQQGVVVEILGTSRRRDRTQEKTDSEEMLVYNCTGIAAGYMGLHMMNTSTIATAIAKLVMEGWGEDGGYGCGCGGTNHIKTVAIAYFICINRRMVVLWFCECLVADFVMA